MVKVENNKKKVFSYLLGTVFLVFFIYSFSLFRPWQPFDERLFYNEEFLPIPQSFGEVFEIINSFVLNSHIVSTNTFFSNHLLLRSDPVAWSILTFIFFFFKKNAFLYHIFQLFLHLTNTILVWLTFYNLTKLKDNKSYSLDNYDYSLISILTGLWSLHGINTEAVLLVTNWNPLLIYTSSFGFILYETYKSVNKKLGISFFEIIFIPILFYFAMSLTELGYTLPLVLFLITFSLSIKINIPIKDSINISLKRTAPYFIGLGLFLMSQLIRPDSSITNLYTAQKSINTFVERNLWLTPQIFMGFLKLLFFPKTLSTYQSNLIHLSENLFSPYSIFCTSIYLIFLILPVVLFILIKKSKGKFLCPLVYCFYFSLFPFLHILTPSYCLIADRYCYFPLFFLLLFVYELLMNFSRKKALKPAIFFFLSLLIVLVLRTSIRITEWNNPYTFFQSAINADKNPLYKAYKLIIFANYADSQKNKSLRDDSLEKSLKLLNISKKRLETNIRNHLHEPLTLKLYGLDSNSLLLKTAFSIATIKTDYYNNEEPGSILSFYEPYIKNHLDLAGINQLLLYASILSKDEQLVNAKKVLEYALQRFPYSPEIMKSLANFYFYEKDFKALERILSQGYKLFPNDRDFLRMFYNYYKLTNDRGNETRFEYLIRLREHLTVNIYKNN